MSALANYLHDLRGRFMSQKLEVAKEAVKAAPPWAVVAWDKFAAIPLEKWATLLAIVYTALQIYFLFRDRRKQRRARK